MNTLSVSYVVGRIPIVSGTISKDAELVFRSLCYRCLTRRFKHICSLRYFCEW